MATGPSRMTILLGPFLYSISVNQSTGQRIEPPVKFPRPFVRLVPETFDKQTVIQSVHYQEIDDCFAVHFPGFVLDGGGQKVLFHLPSRDTVQRVTCATLMHPPTPVERNSIRSVLVDQTLDFDAETVRIDVQGLPIRFTPTPTRARMGANRI